MYIDTCKSNKFSKNQFVWREGNSKDEFLKQKECNDEGKITVVQFYCAVTINYARVYTDPIYQQRMVWPRNLTFSSCLPEVAEYEPSKKLHWNLTFYI